MSTEMGTILQCTLKQNTILNQKSIYLSNTLDFGFFPRAQLPTQVLSQFPF